MIFENNFSLNNSCGSQSPHKKTGSYRKSRRVGQARFLPSFLMKRILLAFALVVSASMAMAQAYEYKVVTIVESIVPMGLGRSRMVEATQALEAKSFTTERTDGKKSDQGDIDRADLKLDQFKETKLLNFYSAVGINFQNIASNDALITSKMNDLSVEGWELFSSMAGVESQAGKDDENGIFITRLIFRRKK